MPKIPLKIVIAAIVFLCIGVAMSLLAPSTEIAVVVAIILLIVFMFAFEIGGVDVVAISVMVLLGLISSYSDKFGLARPLVPASELFLGFSSNAVIAIIAVMIIGTSLDKTGLMSKVAATILKFSGKTEARVIPAIAGTSGVISSFMQNVGAAALFLPVVSRISARTGLSMSRLLMPMGFCSILGGTITMVGSSPLILLNDLIDASNQSLPSGQQMEAWSLFSVTPVGMALLATGIVYFVIAGRYVLPGDSQDQSIPDTNTMKYFQDIYGIEDGLFEMVVPASSPLIGQLVGDVELDADVKIIAVQRESNEVHVGPRGLSRELAVEADNVLSLMAPLDHVQVFAASNGLQMHQDLKDFDETLAATKAGIAEIIIPPGSILPGKSARELWLRKNYGLTLIALHRQGKTLREDDGISDLALHVGDVLVVHTTWFALAHLERDRNFVIITTEYPHEDIRPHKVAPALFFFGLAIFMMLFTDVRLSLALMTGAIGMILSGVLKIEEAYRAVSWKSVFLLASLIPLGLAVETSGTAAWIAAQVLSLLDGVPIWVLQLAVVVLATAFTLVMSNVGATVLLVPVAVNIAVGAGADPAVFALTVALAASNSFFLPTHQVNAIIMGPAGYRVADFMRAGGVMTFLFICVLMVMLNLLY